MKQAFGYIAQVCVYAGFALLIGYFSQAPVYRPIEAGEAQIKLSFAYGGKPLGGCRERTPEELQALPPNMRKTKVCARERVPLTIRFDLDGRTIFEDVLPPSGIRGDGPSRVYRKFLVPVGAHDLVLRLRDSERADGWDFMTERRVDLAAGQNLSVDFDPVAKGFVFAGSGGG